MDTQAVRSATRDAFDAATLTIERVRLLAELGVRCSIADGVGLTLPEAAQLNALFRSIVEHVERFAALPDGRGN